MKINRSCLAVSQTGKCKSKVGVSHAKALCEWCWVFCSELLSWRLSLWGWSLNCGVDLRRLAQNMGYFLMKAVGDRLSWHKQPQVVLAAEQGTGNGAPNIFWIPNDATQGLNLHTWSCKTWFLLFVLVSFGPVFPSVPCHCVWDA